MGDPDEMGWGGFGVIVWSTCLSMFLGECVALQRKNAENLKQIFPEKEYRVGVSVPISTFMCL